MLIAAPSSTRVAGPRAGVGFLVGHLPQEMREHDVGVPSGIQRVAHQPGAVFLPVSVPSRDALPWRSLASQPLRCRLSIVDIDRG